MTDNRPGVNLRPVSFCDPARGCKKAEGAKGNRTIGNIKSGPVSVTDKDVKKSMTSPSLTRSIMFPKAPAQIPARDTVKRGWRSG